MHVYVHIPFCLKKCAYCDFASITDISLIPIYTEALLSEIELWRDLYYNKQVKTVYFGGGTPSILSPARLAQIITKLHNCFTISPTAEISLEANPETVTRDNLLGFRSAGINRLSLGVQSLHDHELQYLGRIHTAEKAKQAIAAAQAVFENVNCDLMLGFPQQTLSALISTVTEVCAFSPQHISCYDLTYEEHTPLYKDRSKKNDDVELLMTATELLEKQGYAQYEISNYAKPGYTCQHNLAYWQDQHYLGLGVAAHSYVPKTQTRFFQQASVAEYSQKQFSYSFESASPFDRIMMGLRLTEGIPAAWLAQDKTAGLQQQGLLKRDAGRIALTKTGRLQMNIVLRELM